MSVINDTNIKTILAQCEGNTGGKECKVEFEGNFIICFSPFTLKNSQIIFRGKNNILYIDKDVIIAESVLNFDGDNSVIFLGSSSRQYKLSLTIRYNSYAYFGKNCSFNGLLRCILSEERNIFIGNDVMFSFGIWLRISDPHLIYDSFTHTRINPTKSIYIGDHVWVGQDVLILKDSYVGSGSILAARTVLSSKIVPSNSLYGGVPAKMLKTGIFWLRNSAHRFTSVETVKFQKRHSSEFIFEADGKQLDFEKMEEALNNLSTATQKLDYLKGIHNNSEKNRFFIEQASPDSQKSYSPLNEKTHNEVKAKTSDGSILKRMLDFLF